MAVKRYTARIACAISAACALSLVAVAGITCMMEHRGARPEGSPHAARADEDGFPSIDWDRWMDVNPDIVGWITIPGTNVDAPIVRAPEDDPRFYLEHDVYGDPNFTGCPYLDADCCDRGLLRCPNSVVFGHNMGWNQDLFGDLENYADAAYAAAHRDALIQTPDARFHLQVRAVETVSGDEPAKQTRFSSADDFSAWWHRRFSHAAVRLGGESLDGKRLLTLCTCSYGSLPDERTIVYCTVADEEGSAS